MKFEICFTILRLVTNYICILDKRGIVLANLNYLPDFKYYAATITALGAFF